MPRSLWSASSALSSGEVSKEENVSLSSREAQGQRRERERESEQVADLSMPWRANKIKLSWPLLVEKEGLWSQAEWGSGPSSHNLWQKMR